MPHFKTLDSIDVQGKRALVRVDLNVPMENGKVSDATRLERIAQRAGICCKTASGSSSASPRLRVRSTGPRTAISTFGCLWLTRSRGKPGAR